MLRTEFPFSSCGHLCWFVLLCNFISLSNTITYIASHNCIRRVAHTVQTPYRKVQTALVCGITAHCKTNFASLLSVTFASRARSP
ncbi:hypothetical protein C8R48DRAFT_719992 [Suillus tomentosus]|nr:hypothetical protein C8R48DRAFT_719992 [Suillus tomentosus]